MTEKYEALAARMEAVLEKNWPLISNLGNAAGVLYQGMEEINWAGFYLMSGALCTMGQKTETDSDVLWLGPFQGKPACVRIELGRGVCGTAARQGRIQLVEDVHQFQGHIACDSESRSELVIPLRKDGKVIGVLDIDSPVRGRFTKEDEDGLSGIAKLIEKVI